MVVVSLNKGELEHLHLSLPEVLRRSILRCRMDVGIAEPADKAVITSSNRPGRAFVLPGRQVDHIAKLAGAGVSLGLKGLPSRQTYGDSRVRPT